MQAPLAPGTPGEKEAEGASPAASAVALGGRSLRDGAVLGARSPGTRISPRSNRLGQAEG